MIGIKGISSYIPGNYLDNIEQGVKFGEDEVFIREKLGALSLPMMVEGDETSDLSCRAIEQLCASSGLKLSAIDALVVVTQNGDAHGLPHTSAIVHQKLGLSSALAAFDVSLGCSGYVYGLSILKGLMQEAGLGNGVLVTCDPYSKVIDRADRVTSMLFGDAATATWLCEDGDWQIGSPLLQTDGSGAGSLCVDGGQLKMNGRQVFNFTALRVPEQINRYLGNHNLEQTDIDFYCLHQGSAAIVDAIARRYPSVRDRFIKDIAHTGNTVSSSIPLLLEKYVLESDACRVLLSGFGVGLSWATNVIERRC